MMSCPKKTSLLSLFVRHGLKSPKDSPGVRKAFEEFSFLSQDVPWCSVFMYFATKTAGFTSLPDLKKAPMARSWLSCGLKKEIPEFLDLVILRRNFSPISGHVGLFCSFDEKKEKVCLLGGNQGGKINFSWFSAKDILEYRELI